MADRSIHFPTLTRRTTYSIRSRYNEYRLEIREDCQGRCVYCDAHENELGGQEVMTLDHFRPRQHYGHLVNDPTNLMWCCPKCNELKGSSWPAIGTSATISGNDGFIDAFAEDRHEYFEVNPDGKLTPLKSPAHYMIKLLCLNRNGLRLIRCRRDVTLASISSLIKFFDSEIAKVHTQLDRTDLPHDLLEQLNIDLKRLEDAKTDAIRLPGIDFTLY